MRKTGTFVRTDKRDLFLELMSGVRAMREIERGGSN